MEGSAATNRLTCKRRLFFAVVVSLLFLVVVARAQFNFAPNISWYAIDMPHCTVVYPRGSDSLALVAGQKAERIYLRLSQIFQEQPTEKIWMVLDTSYDIALDATVPFPNLIVYINPTAFASGLGHYTDWLELVITHEITHAVDMQMRYGLADAIGKITGRFYFPNSLGPQWLTEGVAVYFETALTGGGRSVSPYYDMILRMAFLQDQLTTPDQNCYFLARWPGGSSAYIFGQSYYAYLAKKYGQASIIKMRKRYAGGFLPFRISESLKAAGSAGVQQFYRNWKNDLKKHYLSQADSIRRKKVTSFRRLTKSGYENKNPCWSADGSIIYYISNEPDRHQQIRALNIYTGQQWKIKAVNLSETKFSVSKHGPQKLFFSSIEWQKSYALINDIYMFEIVSAKTTRLTYGLRARDPAVSPRGDKMIFVRQHQGMSDLCLYDLKSKISRRLIRGSQGQQFFQPAWSNGGDKIAISVWEKGGYQNIWILDMNSGRMVPLLQDKAKDISPCWSRDDRYVVFSSDRSGVFNLFAYDLQSQELQQISNVLGGAFEPEVSPDNQNIVFSGYSSRGYDICLMRWRKEQPVKVKKVILGVRYPRLANFVYGFTPTYNYETGISLNKFAGQGSPTKIVRHNYSPLTSLLPRFYIPFLSADEKGVALGAFTFGQDVLNKHAYQLYFQYGIQSHRPGYAFIYSTHLFYPTIIFNASQLTMLQNGKVSNKWGKNDFYKEHRREYGLQLAVPFKKIDYAHSVIFSVNFRSFQRAIELRSEPDNPYFEGNLNSWQIQYVFSNAHKYSRSISPVEGFTTLAEFRQFTKILKSNMSFYQYGLAMESYFSFSWLPRQVLYLSVRSAFNNLKTNKIIENSPQDRIRGFSAFNWRTELFVESMEYRFPIREIEHSTPLLPVFVKRLHGSFFSDAAQYRNFIRDYTHLLSAGIELQLDVVYGYLLEGNIKAGVALPFQRPVIPRYYISFDTPL